MKWIEHFGAHKRDRSAYTNISVGFARVNVGLMWKLERTDISTFVNKMFCL